MTDLGIPISVYKVIITNPDGSVYFSETYLDSFVAEREMRHRIDRLENLMSREWGVYKMTAERIA